MPSEDGLEDSSVVAKIEKEVLLELLENSEVGSPELSIKLLEDEEDLSAWISAVRSWLERSGCDGQWSVSDSRTALSDMIEGTQL